MAEIEAEIRQISRNAGSQSSRRGSALDSQPPLASRFLNRDPDAQFPLIAQVETLSHDPAKHALYAQRTVQASARLRRFFLRLGLDHVPQRHRLSGRSVDRARLHAAALRGDPRLMIARELRPASDLFIGVLIDCSSSMRINDRIETAKLFGTMVAESARGLSGLDVRLWGFTDACVFEAGTAKRCAIHALASAGGNNDAGALWHAAQVAMASRRRARVLVVVSDGSPTECSVSSLRALVQSLTRRGGITCAQVALRPLCADDICFPDYIGLQGDINSAVRAFGRTIARLAGRAATRR